MSSKQYVSNVHTAGPCCAVPTNYVEGHFKNIALREALDKLDPMWHNFLGWVNFYDITTVYGAHIDRNHDCTHIAWSPFLLDPMWLNIAHETKRLSALQRKNNKSL
jgi:hypothetical protein